MSPRNLDAYVELSLAYFEAGKTDEAMSWLKRTLAMDNELPAAHRLLGMVLYHTGDCRAAILHLKKASYYYPDDPMTLLLLGMAHFFNKEEEEYRRIIDVVDQRHYHKQFVLKFVGTELYRHNYFRNAANILGESDELFPADSETLALLGWAHFQLGDPQRAAEIWGRTLSLDPGNGSAEKGLAVLKERSAGAKK